jgi:hypothetical protein
VRERESLSPAGARERERERGPILREDQFFNDDSSELSAEGVG